MHNMNVKMNVTDFLADNLHSDFQKDFPDNSATFQQNNTLHH